MAKVEQKFLQKVDIGSFMAANLRLKVAESQLKKGLKIESTTGAIPYFYKLMQEQEIFEINSHVSKSNVNSKKFREAGNKLFIKGLKYMYEAMQLYNQAICMAEPGNGDELSIAYANRSAVLFEWKQYDLCRDNIELAKKTGCPERLITKLDERDLQCVAMLKTKKTETPVKALYSVDHGKATNATIAFANSIDPSYSYDKYHGEPSLSLTPNSEIPFAVDCLEIKYNSQHGRHIVTNKDLKPGQIVVIENPYAHALTTKDDLYRYTKCANCYEENFLCLIPCASCRTTMYCSEKCLVESKQYHEIECSISDFMLNYGWGDHLAIRMTLKAFASFDSTNDLNKFRKSYNDSEAETTPPSFDDNLTEEQKYGQIYGYKQTNPTKLLEKYCKAASFYHMLIANTKFIDILKSEDDHNTLMELILRHIQIVEWNGIVCSQYKTFDMSDAGDDKSANMYSRGIYPFSSFFQHSCDPNIAIIAKGAKIIVYCSRPIKKGSQLLRSYGNCHYFQHHKAWRQTMLNTLLSITCRCEACTKNYPANYENIPNGNLPSQYSNILGVHTSMLDYEIKNFDTFLEVLEKFDKKSPCLSINEVQLRVHKAMKLKYGDISTKLMVTFKFHPLVAGLNK